MLKDYYKHLRRIQSEYKPMDMEAVNRAAATLGVTVVIDPTGVLPPPTTEDRSMFIIEDLWNNMYDYFVDAKNKEALQDVVKFVASFERNQRAALSSTLNAFRDKWDHPTWAGHNKLLLDTDVITCAAWADELAAVLSPKAKAFLVLLENCWSMIQIEGNRLAMFSNPRSVSIINDQVHCENGPAIICHDGTEVYYLHGVRMQKCQVMTPAEQLDPEEILHCENAEQRRELIRKYGMERLIDKLPHRILDQQGDYTLYSVRLSDLTPDSRWLKMVNPSVGCFHLEAVHPTVANVQQANDRRSGFKGLWNPAQLT